MRRRAWIVLVLVGALACRARGPERIALPFELALGFEFEGAGSVPAEALESVVRRELERLEVATPDKAAIDDAAFALELFYRARGHADVRVDYTFEPELGRARFRVTEGPRVRVVAFELEGVGAMSPALVRAAFEPLASGGAFDEQRLRAALAEVRALYREHGFLRVELSEPEIEIDAERTGVRVRVALVEGPEFRVDAVVVSGGTAELAAREARLARQFTGPVYRPELLAKLEHAFVEDYRRHGHPDAAAHARASFDEESGKTRIELELVPGERVRLAHFRIEGNARTRDAAILGVLGIELGAPYDSEELRRAFRDLYATGLFESLALELEGDGPERTLLVRVVEARSVQIRLEPGWGSYEGPRVLLGIEERNFQGRGQLVALEGSVSVRAQGTRIAWVDRDFLGSSFTSETTFFVERREEPSFDFVRRGFGFFLRRRWGEDWSSTVGYEFRPTDVTDETLPSLPQDLDADSQVAALSLALALDDRDSPLLPTRGRQGRARLEWADDGVGSDTEFVRAQLEYTQLVPLGADGVLAASARSGVIAPFGSTAEIPLPERFFNGGENSVRSFREDELLPAGASGDPTGGEAATTLNLEWRQRLTGNLAGAAFVDWGNVAFEVQDYLDFEGFRTGLGVGLRYLLPIGPVRADLGFNPGAEDDEDELVLHFSVGFPF
jgi:outer membrane protein assembly complex protein YaeT